jgi:hypothetical protein
MKRRTRDEHLFDPGPKRMLALDGGGIRGALTLGFLKRMEDLLRERHGDDPEFRLCDYFDLIGGTSTGSIIAAGLAMGFSVDKLQEIYKTLSDEVFKRPLLSFGLLSAKFPQEPLIKALTDYFGEATLGSDDLRTGLMIVTKRLDTGSPWVLHNNPRGKYFGQRGKGHIPNKDYLVRAVVRASAAAPHYFEPERLQIAEDVVGAFVDGGVSPYNNPAIQLLMLATLEGYGLKWPFGADKLLLVSVGTGYRDFRLEAEDILEMPAVQLAAQSILSIMGDCDWLSQTILQWMSRSPMPWQIDSEIGDLQNDIPGTGQELISYLRYNVRIETAWIKQYLGLELPEEEVNGLIAMDQPKNVRQLGNLGATAAAVQIQEDHFPAGFDIAPA